MEIKNLLYAHSAWKIESGSASLGQEQVFFFLSLYVILSCCDRYFISNDCDNDDAVDHTLLQGEWLDGTSGNLWCELDTPLTSKQTRSQKGKSY